MLTPIQMFISHFYILLFYYLYNILLNKDVKWMDE